jgi:GNAT superfamily N-acetyltransferase
MEIRPAALDDVEAIARNHVAAWQSGYRGLIADEVLDGLDVGERVDRWRGTILRDAPGEALLVVDEDGPRGHVHVAPATRPYHEGGEIISLYLSPDAWGHGYGRALLVAAREALVALGYEELGLWVLDGNERAQGLYLKDGWAFDGAREPFVMNGVDYGVDELHMHWTGPT